MIDQPPTCAIVANINGQAHFLDHNGKWRRATPRVQPMVFPNYTLADVYITLYGLDQTDIPMRIIREPPIRTGT